MAGTTKGNSIELAKETVLLEAVIAVRNKEGYGGHWWEYAPRIADAVHKLKATDWDPRLEMREAREKDVAMAAKARELMGPSRLRPLNTDLISTIMFGLLDLLEMRIAEEMLETPTGKTFEPSDSILRLAAAARWAADECDWRWKRTNESRVG